MKQSTMSMTKQTFQRRVEELAEKLRIHPNKDEILKLMEEQLLDDNQ